MRALKTILYGFLGFMLYKLDVNIIDWEFWVVLVIVIGIDTLEHFTKKDN